MSIEDFIIAVFCLIDEEIKNILGKKRLRARGPDPALSDGEVITMEIVGEFLGKDADKIIWEYFIGLQTTLRDNMEEKRPRNYLR